MHPAHVLGVAAVLCAASPALADPFGAFRSGTTVRLRNATASTDANRRSTGGVSLTKAAGTLDFDVAASDLGIPLPITAHLRGEPIGDALVSYSFSWSGSLVLDRAHTLTGLTGALYARFAPVPGTRASVGNVEMDVLPIVSTITATGNWGRTVVSVEEASLDGGYPTVPLARYARTESSTICSSPRSSTTLSLSIEIGAAAPASGEWVFVKSANHRGLALPTVVFVPAGKRSATFRGTIAPSFAGTVHTIARAGGRTLTLDLAVNRC
jgi:hypothetical protein